MYIYGGPAKPPELRHRLHDSILTCSLLLIHRLVIGTWYKLNPDIVLLFAEITSNHVY
jgi:hypothetical protein